MKSTDSLLALRDRLRAFADARGWRAYHNPKNLAMALAVEAAELMEPFQWLTPDECLHLDNAQQEAVRDELADVLIYLVELADVLGVDLIQAVDDKLKKNAVKYPE